MHYIFAEVRFFWRNQPTLLMKSTGRRFSHVLTLLMQRANTFDAKG